MNNGTAGSMARYQAARRAVLALVVLFGGIGLIFSGSARSEFLHEAIEGYGLALILVGIGGRLWATLYIDGRKSSEVVQSGPYSIMRNPLYFFSTIAIMGVGAQTGSIMIALICAAVCALCFHFVALHEERYLAERLGQAYLNYKARVPRFFPNPTLYRDQAMVTFRPRYLNRTLLDGLVFFVSIPVLEFIESGQALGWIPVYLQLY
ncbi:methyltransferase family protein [Tianweitania sediminis]|uniref:Isoprenylcysteine carboxylmethyltransferase family protein n=1 Tax=Tianweitania sediminis TaxID=1502156 RepID=A0A8J7UJM7_9HYPH|nr:isoprenylcysteine carboxylmethyltransferase family protein [Tianweitania sediminis]MBP0437482.1 isoprenylcysteine carboxylmethyltransferase family protein [Tianweitania sediminis]